MTNRTGATLGTADCSVTVADQGAAPRTTPTGTVNFTATDGLLPASGSCTLQQTPFSPGVAACTAQFSVPADFPIAVAFPITADYQGDANFGGASTSHSMIQAGCVGDAAQPCTGAVALTFADIPKS